MKERTYKMAPMFPRVAHVNGRLGTSMDIVGIAPKGGRIVFELNDMPPFVLKAIIKQCISALLTIRQRASDDVEDIEGYTRL